MSIDRKAPLSGLGPEFSAASWWAEVRFTSTPITGQVLAGGFLAYSTHPSGEGVPVGPQVALSGPSRAPIRIATGARQARHSVLQGSERFDQKALWACPG